MKMVRILMAMGLAASVSACASVDVPTRNMPFEPLPEGAVQAPAGYALLDQPRGTYQDAATGQVAINHPDVSRLESEAAPSVALAPAMTAPVTINSVTVRVPRSLKVSEANSYIPRGDIVWREDPIGDRHAQVQKIVQDAMARGVTPLNGPINADLHIEVAKFHALTEKARYTTGGVHAITFQLALKDATTGELLMPVKTVKADLDAFGGKQALQAEGRGLTQKVRITNHLAEVIRQELSSPEGYKNASLGVIQLMNRM